MSKIRNLVIHSDDVKVLKGLAEDYKFMGFDIEQAEGKLIIFAIHRKLKTRKQRMKESKEKQKSRVKRSWPA